MFEDHAELGVAMPDFPESAAALVEYFAPEAAERLTKASKHAVGFMLAAQSMMLEEVVFASNELLDRSRTEMHLFAEFASKLAGSHSVEDLKTMYQECGKHQIDFIRRDSDRLFKHGERMIKLTEKILSKPPGSNGRVG
jgi:hypothetical protein